MAVFELHQDYPLSQIVDEAVGFWIVEELLKGLSSSEAILLLQPSHKKEDIEVEFPSSHTLLVCFHHDKSLFEREALFQTIGSMKTLWIFVVTESTATPIRVVRRPISYLVNPNGRFALTIPMEPPLSLDEWRQLGMTYTSVVTINESEWRHIGSEQDVEELCHGLGKLSSFWLHATRFEGGELDVSADSHGVVVNYLDIKRGIKLTSLDEGSVKTDIVRQKIDALPHMELETERRHLISHEKALEILRSFLTKGEPIGMVTWPLDG